MPEARLTLAQVVTFLACAPKSNASYVALKRASEAVANHGDIGAAFQNFAKPPEEVGAVAGQVLHTLGQCQIEAAAKVGNLGAGLGIAGFRGFQGSLKRANLGPQRRQLLVEQGHLGIGLIGKLFGL